MATDRHGDSPDDLVEPEGVNAGGPITRSATDRPTMGEATGSGPNGDRGTDPAGQPAARDNGELLSGADPEPTRRPPQPGQELSVGEG